MNVVMRLVLKKQHSGTSIRVEAGYDIPTLVHTRRAETCKCVGLQSSKKKKKKDTPVCHQGDGERSWRRGEAVKLSVGAVNLNGKVRQMLPWLQFACLT